MTLGLKTASCPVILRFSALSSFAPRANLLRFSLFSGVGSNRCCCKRLLFSRSNPFVISLISATRESPLPHESVVLTVGVNDGEAEYVEKRADARLDPTVFTRE